jgi:IS605 OrfB family transposase
MQATELIDARNQRGATECNDMNIFDRAIPPLTVGKRARPRSAALIFDVRFEDFQSGPADRAQEEAARPEGTRMLTPIHRAKTIQHSRRAFAFQRPNKVAQYYGGRVPKQHVDMVLFTVKFEDLAIPFERYLLHTGLEKVSLLRSECMPAKFGAKHDVYGQVVNTVACTVKIKIPDTLAHRLSSLLPVVATSVARMLRNRDEASSKYYPELPSVVSKSLIAKYQRNGKCKTASNLIIPVCGDKERQIRFQDGGVRIFSIFGKEILPIKLAHPIVADELGRRNISAEFFQRGGEWYGAFSYNTPAAERFQPTGMIGVDRNSVGHVATMADPATGKVFHLGFNPAHTKQAWRGRKANLQRAKKNRLLCKIKRKQSRRTKHENHIVSKVIVDYAATHRRAIAIEDLGQVRAKGSKIRSYTERSQWAFFQLGQFIRYKAALRGVEIIEVCAAYSSQECSRCHGLTKPSGKKFVCSHCSHKDHRDANAAFTLAQRVMPIGGLARDSVGSRSALLVEPFLGSTDGHRASEAATCQ